LNQLRITTENRTRLETVIPLDTPYVIFIDPSNVCNQKCSYCPTGNLEMLSHTHRKPAVMNLELYKRIIDQCCVFPSVVKTLRLYKDGEPLLNANFAKMVRYARDTGRFGLIDTTSNGLLLNVRMTRDIVIAGLDRINLSVPKDYNESYIDNVAFLYKYGDGRLHVFAKIAGDYLTPDEREKFINDFAPITHAHAIEHTAPCWPWFEVVGVNPDVGVYGQKLEDKVNVCPYVFYQMAVNADGTVSVCFLDWCYGSTIGDLRDTTLMEIWNSRLLKAIQIQNLAGNRKAIPICSDCQQLKYGMPDNIDPYAKALLRRMK